MDEDGIIQKAKNLMQQMDEEELVSFTRAIMSARYNREDIEETLRVYERQLGRKRAERADKFAIRLVDELKLV